jgi:hypothetical protein
MKIAMKRLISTILVVQSLAIPITSVELLAAPPFDPQGPQTAAPASAANFPAVGRTMPSDQSTPYFTDIYGNILMNVNVWGSAVHTGPITVPEGSDLATVISIAGGPAKGANLDKVRVNRTQPDRDGKMTYLVNLNNYAQKGDRSTLIDMQPNDTIIIPESRTMERVGFILGVIAVGISVYSIGH